MILSSKPLDPAALLLVGSLLVAHAHIVHLLPPPPELGLEVVRMGEANLFEKGVQWGCGWVERLFPCERTVAPVATVVAYGVCAAIFWEVAATPCMVAGGLSFGIGAGAAVISDPETCIGDAASWRAYDQCWTANWGATEQLVTNAKQGDVTLADAGGTLLDVVGSTVPVQFGNAAKVASGAAKAATVTKSAKTGKTATILAEAGGDVAKAKKASEGISLATRVSDTRLVQGVKAGLTGNSELMGSKMVQKGRAWQATSITKAGGWDVSLKKGSRWDWLSRGAKPKQSSFLLETPNAAKRSLQYRAGQLTETAGRYYQKPMVGFGVKGLPDLYEGFHSKGSLGVNLAANTVANGAANPPPGWRPPETPPAQPDATEGPDGPPGVGEAGGAGHHVRVEIHAPDPARRETFPSGISFPLTFVVSAEAGVSWWSVWMGKLKLAGTTYPEPPTRVYESVVLNTPTHPLPSGHYSLTVAASDGVTHVSAVVYFAIANHEGRVEDVYRSADASCQVDLNRNGYPDCVDAFANSLVPPTQRGEPNVIAVVVGLVVIVGSVAWAVLAFRRN